MPDDKEYVKELANKLRGGEINHKEALKGLKERALVEHERWEIIPWAIYFILWLPLNVTFSDQLPAVHFPLVVICISLVLAVLGMYVGVWAYYMHYKRGGLKHEETVILFREGPYRIIRHPMVGPMMLPILLPIILSAHVPFTPLSIAAIIVMIVYTYYDARTEEEKLDIPKWGDEYLQYMKEVPRFNFVKGLWNLRKRKK